MKTTIQMCGLLAAAVAAVSCGYVDQPRPQCLVGHGGFAAKYTLRPGQTVTGPCTLKLGETIGVQKYERPDGTNALAIRPGTLAAVDTVVPISQITSLGQFDKDPNAENFCTGSNLSIAQASFPGDPANEIPAVDAAYEWQAFEVYVTPQVPGTQLRAGLRYSEGGCTAEYDVTAVFPSVTCAGEDGVTPDEAACALADINLGLALNPDFAVVCDPQILLCVLAGPVPSLR